MEKKGIDISSAQGNIQFESVKNSVDFVMIRTSWGFYHEDTMFRKNASECEKYGIPYGFYHYSYALNLEDAKIEVSSMLQSIKDYHPTYPIVIDMEDADGWKASHGNPSNQMYIQICKFFCEEIEKAGYYAMIYANLDWFNNRINSRQLDSYDKWLAQWSNKPTYGGKFGIWQYSSTGKISGIQGNVDLDISYYDYPEIIKKRGLNHYNEGYIPPAEREDEYKIIKDWQKVMNLTYQCHLAEDNSFGPDSRAKANKYYLYYKKNTIKNDHVRFVQQRLKNLGYNIVVDRSYGPITREIVMQFQRDRKIQVDGFVGAITTETLFKDN